MVWYYRLDSFCTTANVVRNESIIAIPNRIGGPISVNTIDIHSVLYGEFGKDIINHE